MQDIVALTDRAVLAAKRAGQIQSEGFGKLIKIGYKGPKNLITEIDQYCETAITSIIKEKYPDHGILAEEGGLENPDSPFRWIIDPLDGTTNYAHAYPCFSVSIAFEQEREIVLGVVYNPILDELFLGVKGQGAFLNNRPISVSKTNTLENALLATGRLTKRENIDMLLTQYRILSSKSQAVRIDGSAALDICYVAMGRYDGFWEFGLNSWDTAAGSIILMEAGGKISSFSGRPYNIFDNELLTSNGAIHNELIESLTLHPNNAS